MLLGEIFKNETFWGFSSTLIKLETLFDNSGINSNPQTLSRKPLQFLSGLTSVTSLIVEELS